MKLIVTKIPTNVVENSKFFCTALKTKNKNQVLTCLSGNKIFLFFVYGESHSTSKPFRIQ